MSEKKWLRLTTDPNIRDEFNRYLLTEKIGSEVLYMDPATKVMRSHNPPEYEYLTFMTHQERDNSGTGFPVGDWWTREEFRVYKHLVVGHYGQATDYSGNTGTGWIGDELIIYSDPPLFLEWEQVEMPTAFEGADEKVAALVVRDTSKELPVENAPSPR